MNHSRLLQLSIVSSNQFQEVCSIPVAGMFLVIGHLYLSGVQLGVTLRTDKKKNMCWKETELSAQNFLAILDATVNIRGNYMIIK